METRQTEDGTETYCERCSCWVPLASMPRIGDTVRVYDKKTRWTVTASLDMDGRISVTTQDDHTENLFHCEMEVIG